jgi:hypothetical protein
MNTPFLDDAVIEWANRKDLSEVWINRIAVARNEIDWRGELTYVYQYWLEETA